MSNFARTDKDLTKPIPAVLLLCQRAMYFFKLKTNFIAKSQLLYIECQPTRERKQKKNPTFIFKGVRFWESVNTEFNWELTLGFEKASVSRAVRLRECPAR